MTIFDMGRGMTDKVRDLLSGFETFRAAFEIGAISTEALSEEMRKLAHDVFDDLAKLGADRTVVQQGTYSVELTAEEMNADRVALSIKTLLDDPALIGPIQVDRLKKKPPAPARIVDEPRKRKIDL